MSSIYAWVHERIEPSTSSNVPTRTLYDMFMDDRENQLSMRGLTMKKFTTTLSAYYKVERKTCEGEKQSVVTDYILKRSTHGDVNMCDDID